MPYSCFIIGKDALLIECATILRQNDFQIKGIISADRQVSNYCSETGLRNIDPNQPFEPVLKAEPFDYLFSIINEYILPEAILQLPRRHTINYHDGPLPAYAGVHATFWALINQERKHAITWHIVDTGIDTGPILKQRWLAIEPEDTSIRLNITCYSAAEIAFRELVGELVSDAFSILPQDFSRRTYFGRNLRPDLFFDFQKPAAEMTRLFRALDFGFHPNPFGFLKIRLGTEFFLVKEVKEASEEGAVSNFLPGEITALQSDELRVSTAHGLLIIREVSTRYGKPVSISDLAQKYSLTTGQILTQPDDGFRRNYHQIDVQSVRHQSYWVKKLRDFSPTTLSIATSPLTNESPKSGFEWVEVGLPPVIKSALESLPSVADKTDRLLTAFLITVGRLANQPSVSVGYCGPQSSRIAAGTDDLFADYVPFSMDVNWNSDFETAVSDFQKERTFVEKNLTFSRDLLVSQPVLQSVAQTLAEHSFPIIINRSTQANDPVLPDKSLAFVHSDKLVCRVAYDSAVWRADQVAEVINRWLIVLEKLVLNPEQPLKTVDLLTPVERQRIVVDWNATDVPYPRHQLIHQLVEEQARQKPNAVALYCGSASLTYAQLNQRANQLARYLQKQGVEPGTLVGICTERSVEMIISLLAILKTGGAYVPLEPSYPPSRLSALSKQTRIQFILTHQIGLNRLPTEGITHLLLDEKPSYSDNHSTQNLAIPTNADPLAYVLFTSGSTGRPKSVAIPHRGVVRLVKGANYVALDETVIMLGLAPLAFDASTFEIWGCLANGGKLVLIPDNRPTFDVLKQSIQTHQVNTAFFTTALFNALVDSGIAELTMLSQVITGGEAASAEHVRRAHRQLPFCAFINAYGPTESTTYATYHNLAANPWETSSVPIGKPLSNTRIYIVDSFLNPVPAGIPGELLIGGDGLAREYLFQPDLTREQFIADPFNHQPGNRLYRTGDQARYRSDGTIEFLGRIDEQIKLSGFRIEPGEIEHALTQHPAVGEAFVLAVEPTPGRKMLAAYYIPKPGAEPEPNELRAFLQDHLPSHLIPTAFIPLNELPLTRNGKRDKSQLPPVLLGSRGQEKSVLSPTETALMPLWSAVLGNSGSSCEDNFFELGGSSILAMQLIARIHQHLERLLTMRDLFEYPTVRRLSAFLDQTPRSDLPCMTEPKTAHSGDLKPIAPLSFAQNRLWIIHQLHALQGTYNVPIVLKINGSMDLPVLEQSLEKIVRRHEILRTTFSHSDGLPFQRTTLSDSVSLQVNEWNDQKTGELDQWLKAEMYRPFNLETGPLFRIRVANLGEDSWLLLMVFHHIIYDGWSTRVLANELSLIYSAFVQDQPVTVPELPLQYADFARWQIEHFTPQTLQRELAYWKNRLSGAPVLLNLPIDKLRPATQSFEGADHSFHIPAERWGQIRTGLQEPGTTVFLRLLTVFSVWLSRITHRTDIVVGIPVAGRNRSEWVDIIGFFVNTVALRVEIREEKSFRQLLRQVRQWALEAYDHQDLPFEQVVEALKLPRTLAYTPLVQAIFDFQDDHSKDWKLDGLQVETVPVVQHTSKFDLHLSFREAADGVEGIVTYRTDLFTSQAIEWLTHDFEALLDQLAAHPDKALGDLTGKPGQLSGFAPAGPATETADQEVDEKPLSAEDDPLIDLVRSIWCWLLEMPAVGLEDDFFEIGGHSLLAFQLTTELQRQTGHAIPVGTVFANPTIRKLVIHLKTAHPDLVWQSLVAVRPEGNKPPVFFVHPISGDIGYAYQLVPFLPDDRPVYGLRAVGLDGIAKPFSSLENMASHYLELILGKQPDGPYTLGGYSMGGVIAFEIARQLKNLGKEVSLVALIDSYPVNPDVTNPDRIPLGQLLDYYYYYWRSLTKSPGSLWTFFRKKTPVATGMLLNRLRNSGQNRKPQKGVLPTEMPVSEHGKLLKASSLQAYSAYTFKSYDGKVVLLRAIGNDGFTNHRQSVKFGWDRHAKKGVDVHSIPGNHHSLFANEETISKIGAVLTSYLNN